MPPAPNSSVLKADTVPADQEKQLLESLAREIPLGRVADPDEIAKVAVLLASDDSSFVNGIELFVDGGSAQI